MSRSNRVLLLAALFSWSMGGWAVERLPVETFTRHYVYDTAKVSPDGSKLVFASNRHAAKEGDTNVFIADWVSSPGK